MSITWKQIGCVKTGSVWLVCSVRGPQPQRPRPDDLKWNRCNSNRNEVHNVMSLNHSGTTHIPRPSLHKNCLLPNWSLEPERLGTAVSDKENVGGGQSSR